jgi:type III secretory pathway component EscR
MKRRIAIIILSISLLLVTADALITNYLISHGASELNPLVASIAGTQWLVIIKSGWVVLFLVLVATVKNRRLL